MKQIQATNNIYKPLTTNDKTLT